MVFTVVVLVTFLAWWCALQAKLEALVKPNIVMIAVVINVFMIKFLMFKINKIIGQIILAVFHRHAIKTTIEIR